MERLVLFLLPLLFSSIISTLSMPCSKVMEYCEDSGKHEWMRCYEKNIANCSIEKTRRFPRVGGILDGFIQDFDSPEEVNKDTVGGHSVRVPSRVMKRSWTPRKRVAVMVFNSTLFEGADGSEFLGNHVISVKVGQTPLLNLSEPVILTFRYDQKDLLGSCKFWEEAEETVNKTAGRWSTRGCSTNRTDGEFICSCDHLSFFAVLVNTGSISDAHARSLSYITYFGCGLSILCTSIAIIMYIYMRRPPLKTGREEHSMGLHLHLMGALLLLHSCFLLSAWQAERATGGGACLALGLLLHWALLATFTWMGLESFHLYLLLVRVFNIYIRRYLLKLSFVGWGVPTITVAVCAFSNPYGLHSFQSEDNTHSRTYTEICWITNATVRHVTVTAYLTLVFLVGAAMLGIVVIKLLHKEHRGTAAQKRHIGRNCLTLLCLSCILGVPWGLAFFTYGPLTLVGLYFFTIANAFQGVSLFLWFLSLTSKSNASSTRSNQSTRKTDISLGQL
ncbi:adhesion G-protein coupled receptor G1-like [Brienomyrus brachyistius]|uniref:adhesion G-protein coupled receptor G1-like n=1 Tax=Brienomyrus brachyistius TaxID=42636 RepID=UPI0020B2578C|nr:adhesion G-protein coupled receptor G1-like [Brienomyrus brachyistius]